MVYKHLKELTQNIIDGHKITSDEAASLLTCDLQELLYQANRLRMHYKEDKVKLCSIINAKSGQCSQDCKFCAQSAHHNVPIETYPLVSIKEIEAGLRKAVDSKAQCFGIVTSGHSIVEDEINQISLALRQNKQVCNALHPYAADSSKGNVRIKFSASLGCLGKEDIAKLRESGLQKFHHNLETSESFFPNICTTQNYSERIDTIKAAKQAGLEVCSGGIIGLGETSAQRLELAFTLRELDVDSVPINILNPIVGTPLENQNRLSVSEILRTIAVFRFVLPEKDISICGGREVNLRDMQSWMFYAGANGMMIGGYLTTPGRPVETDLKMIEDLGLKLA